MKGTLAPERPRPSGHSEPVHPAVYTPHMDALLLAFSDELTPYELGQLVGEGLAYLVMLGALLWLVFKKKKE